MLKKSLFILFIIFSILCISSICFATNTANNVKNAVGKSTNTVVDGMSNLAGGIRNGVGHVENGIEDALTMDEKDNTNTRTSDNFTNGGTTSDTSNYTATRTATTTDTTGILGIDTSTMWVWLVVAIAAIGIVALVWFYGSQNRVD